VNIGRVFGRGNGVANPFWCDFDVGGLEIAMDDASLNLVRTDVTK
jgi:hypothetical protein